MQMTTLIDEHVCCDETKVQLWTCQHGYDIVVIKDGVVQSTVCKSDKLSAELLFLEISKELDNKANTC